MGTIRGILQYITIRYCISRYNNTVLCRKAVGVPERGLFTLRDRTVRPNIAYAVVGYERKEEDEIVRQLVEEKWD